MSKPRLTRHTVKDMGDIEIGESPTVAQETPADADYTSIELRMAEAVFDLNPTKPRAGDLPGFRRAFNKMLVEKHIEAENYDTLEALFKENYEKTWINTKGLDVEVEVMLLRDLTYAPMIGPLNLPERYPAGLKNGERIQLPLYAAQHLMQVGAATILRGV